MTVVLSSYPFFDLAFVPLVGAAGSPLLVVSSSVVVQVEGRGRSVVSLSTLLPPESRCLCVARSWRGRCTWIFLGRTPHIRSVGPTPDTVLLSSSLPGAAAPASDSVKEVSCCRGPVPVWFLESCKVGPQNPLVLDRSFLDIFLVFPILQYKFDNLRNGRNRCLSSPRNGNHHRNRVILLSPFPIFWRTSHMIPYCYLLQRQ